MQYLKTIAPYQKEENLGNGLMIIKDAFNIHARSEINGIQSLDFDIPNDSRYLQHINDDVWFDIEGSWFFAIENNADNTTHTTHYSCRHITALMSINNMIPDFPIMVAVSPFEILSKGIELCGNDYWELIPPEELPEELEWVDSLTDVVDGFEKISLWELINKTMELVGYGELYFKNRKFAIVKRIGRDTSKVWSPVNIERVKKSINYAEISNALLVLGTNDMPLDIDKYPGSMIYSEESIEKYGKRYKILNFPDVLDKEELEKLALWEISPDNTNRIDTPKISIDVNAYEVDKKEILSIGDGVRIINKELNIDEIKRVVAIDYYPIQPYRSKYTIGDKSITLEEMLAKQEQTINTIKDSIDEKNEIKISSIQQLAPVLQSGKNFVFNSSFEVFSSEGLPQNWDCTNGAKISDDSQNWGSYSLMIPNGASAIQSENAAIPISYYATESNGTIIAFSHKWGSVKVSIIDADGNKIMHKSKFNTEKVEETIVPYDVYYREFTIITFLHEDIQSEDKKYRIKFECIDEVEAYIDNVMATPNKNNVVPLYRDGPKSISYEQIASDTGSGESSSKIDYTANIEFDNLESNISVSSSSSVLSTTIYKRNLDTENFNINIQTSLILSQINSDIQMEVKVGGNTQYTITKKYNSTDDIFTFAKTISLPVSLFVNDELAVEVVCSGTFTVNEGSSLTCIISKNKNQSSDTILLNIPLMALSDSGTLTEDISGVIYKNKDEEIIMDVTCKNTAKLAPVYQTILNDNTEIYQSVQKVNFITKNESIITDLPMSYFSYHASVQEVNGLDIFGDDATSISMWGTFMGCRQLIKVSSLPKNVSTYREAFKNCIKLKEIPVLNGMTNVYDGQVSMYYTFQGCSNIEEINLNIYTENYGGIIPSLDSAFSGCAKLKTINGILNGGEDYSPSTCASAFSNCTKLTGLLNMPGFWGSDEEGYEYYVSNCFEHCSTADSASLILNAPDSGNRLISTKSDSSNITLA